MRLIQSVKNILKRILPPPVKTFNREIERVLLAVQKGQEEVSVLLQITRELKQHIESSERQYTEQMEQLEQDMSKALDHQQARIEDTLLQIEIERKEQILELRRDIIKRQTDISAAIQETKRQSVLSTRSAEEAVWAAVFNNSITNSTWLKDKTFSPGRWALGYPALYVIYRVLNEARPKRILELGLGQSTRLIGQYAAAFDDVEHIVVEHDLDWIRFFQNDFQLSERSQIVQLDREMIPYKEAEEVRVFKGFREAFAEKKFDFICIDAPLGGDMKQYARIDVLGILPSCLMDSFVITLDDCERIGETHTMNEIEGKLLEAKIPYGKGRYSGKKDICLLASDNQRFLCSL